MNQDLQMETRLMVLGTRHDLQDDSDTPASVVADLRNSSSDIKTRVLGVSVESAGFTNIMRNVPPKLTSLEFTTYGSTLPGFADGTRHTVTIPANQYNLDTFSSFLQGAFDIAFGAAGIIQVTALVPAGLAASIRYRLLGPYDGGGAGEGYITIEREGRTLARPMGVNRGEVFTITQAASVTKLPMLQGDQVVYIYSKALTAHRSSLGGHQVADAIIGSIPITVPFGFVQMVQLSDAQRPAIVYGGMTVSQLETVDLSFRDSDRDVIDMPGGEIWCTVRLWLKSF